MQIHTVERGQNISAISRLYGVPAPNIIRDNQLDYPDRLVVGQALVIREPLRLYTIRPGDNLFRIAQNNGVSVDALLRENAGLSSRSRALAGQQIRIPAPPRYARSITVSGYCYPFIPESTLQATLPYLTYLNSFSYNITGSGEILPINDNAILTAARRRHVAPVMVVTSFDESGQFGASWVQTILQDPALQEQILDNIMPVLAEKNFAGLDVDFEYMRREDRHLFTALLQRYADRLQPAGYLLSVATAVRTEAGHEGVVNAGFDYAAIGQIVDLAFIMSYDWGYRYGDPMPISPYNMVERALQYTVSEIPSRRVLMGMPNYAYDWRLPHQQGNQATLLSNREAVDLAALNRAEIHFDQTTRTPYFQYWDALRQEHIVWFDDARSFEAKLGLIERFNLAGFGYWNINTLFLPGWLVAAALYDIRIAASIRTE